MFRECSFFYPTHDKLKLVHIFILTLDWKPFTLTRNFFIPFLPGSDTMCIPVILPNVLGMVQEILYRKDYLINSISIHAHSSIFSWTSRLLLLTTDPCLYTLINSVCQVYVTSGWSKNQRCAVRTAGDTVGKDFSCYTNKTCCTFCSVRHRLWRTGGPLCVHSYEGDSVAVLTAGSEIHRDSHWLEIVQYRHA